MHDPTRLIVITSILGLLTLVAFGWATVAHVGTVGLIVLGAVALGLAVGTLWSGYRLFKLLSN